MNPMNLQTQVPVGKITRNIDACRGYHGEARDTEDQKRLRQPASGMWDLP